MAEAGDLGHRRALLLIALVWAAHLALFQLLGWAGFGTGLGIWPMGEDRNWIALLGLPTAGDTARGFWAIDHRNPLSPWWYIAAKPLILGFEPGLFLLRHLVGLGLACAGYALFASWLGVRGRRLAAAIGCLVALHTANAFFDQIYWNFLGALSCSLLSVIAWLEHRRRGGGSWLALSLVLWLVAVASYSLQAGAIAAIGLAALLRPAPGCETPWRRLCGAAGAVWPYALIFLVFVLIWQTTTMLPATESGARPSVADLLHSLRMGLWHEDHGLMLAVLALSPNRVAYLAVSAAIFLAVLFALRRLPAPALPASAIAGAILLAACFALPTVAVESLGSQWPPGSRWRMLYQLTTPVFALGALGLTVQALPARAAAPLWRAGLALSCAFAVLLSLAHNERQRLLTRNEKGLRTAILTDIGKRGLPAEGRHYLVFLDDGLRWFASDTLSGVYAGTWFRGLPVTLRLLPSPLYAAFRRGPPPVFGEDGVAAATVTGETLPYARIGLVGVRGAAFVALERLSQAEVPPSAAEWRRTAPLDLAPAARP